MIPKFLKPTISDFSFQRVLHHPGPNGGRMWKGDAMANFGHATFSLELFREGDEEETEVSLLPHLTIKSVRINTKTFNPTWHCLFTEEGVWYHWDGWETHLGSHKNDLLSNTLVSNPPTPIPVHYSREQERELLGMGFTFLGEGRKDLEVQEANTNKCGTDWNEGDILPVREKLDGARIKPVCHMETRDDAEQVAVCNTCENRICSDVGMSKSEAAIKALESTVTAVTKMPLLHIPAGTELVGEMIELEHIQVVNGDDVVIPKFLYPGQYTLVIPEE